MPDCIRRCAMHAADSRSASALLTLRSYWLGARQPCLTFGLRGVIHATVKVRPLAVLD